MKLVGRLEQAGLDDDLIEAEDALRDLNDEMTQVESQLSSLQI